MTAPATTVRVVFAGAPGHAFDTVTIVAHLRPVAFTEVSDQR